MPQRNRSGSKFCVLFGIKMQDDPSLLLDQIQKDCEVVPGSVLFHKKSQTLMARCKVGFLYLFYIHCTKDELFSICVVHNFYLNYPLLVSVLV